MAQLYHRIILQHCKQPLNKGSLKSPSVTFDGANPFCGDEQRFELRLDDQDRIQEVAWSGKGCAISQAAASIFSEKIRGKKLSAVQQMKSEGLLDDLKMQLSPTRIKCALMPLYTIKGENIEND